MTENKTSKLSARELIKQNDAETSTYSVAAESMSIDAKLKVLEAMDRPDLIDVFKDWKPNQTRTRKKSAPLDQRVSITVTNAEKVSLQNDLNDTNKIGTKIGISQFIRNRAMGSIDINDWKTIAEKELNELNETDKIKLVLKKNERMIKTQIDGADGVEEERILEKRLYEVVTRLKKLVAQNEQRTNRLTGRMNMFEAETIKWRAARLCISTSDYLRLIIFSHLPASKADAHLSLDARRRFYISIIDVANNGWGDPPTIAHCSQCVVYIDEIEKLRDRVRQLETFA